MYKLMADKLQEELLRPLSSYSGGWFQEAEARHG
jgi:hypothetical protein